MNEQRYAEIVEKYLAGKELTPSGKRVIAYGYTAGTCGQRVSSSITTFVVEEK